MNGRIILFGIGGMRILRKMRILILMLLSVVRMLVVNLVRFVKLCLVLVMMSMFD